MNASALENVSGRSLTNGERVPALPLSLGSILSGAADGGPTFAETSVSVRIVWQSGAPRWILPADSRRALSVLKSWRPYRAKSRMKWSAVIAACRLNVLGLLPGTTREDPGCDLSYWRQHLPGFSDSWAAVGYIGNPSPTRKALLFFVDIDHQVRAVVKVPLCSSARAAIVHEGNILQKLRNRIPVPRVIFSDARKGITAQSWVRGANAPRAFTRDHLELLMQLASDQSSSPLTERYEKLAPRCASLSGSVEPSLIDRALSLLKIKEEMRRCMEHGDFTPWNLRRLMNGQLTVIDWEWSVEDGYPLQDICRYFYMQAFLFREAGNVWNRLKTNSLVAEYQQRLNLSAQAVRALATYFLLRFACDQHDEGNQAKVKFAAQQIHEVLVQ